MGSMAVHVVVADRVIGEIPLPDNLRVVGGWIIIEVIKVRMRLVNPGIQYRYYQVLASKSQLPHLRSTN